MGARKLSKRGQAEEQSSQGSRPEGVPTAPQPRQQVKQVDGMPYGSQPQMDYSRQKETPRSQGYPGQAGNIVSGERMPYGGQPAGPMVQQDTANAQTANARPGMGGPRRRFSWQTKQNEGAVPPAA
jgi:hypothetical protein